MTRHLLALARASTTSAAPHRALRAFASHVDLPTSDAHTGPPGVGGAASTSVGRGRRHKRRAADHVVGVNDQTLKPRAIPADAPESLKSVYGALAKLPPRPPPLTAVRPSWLPPEAHRSDPLLSPTKYRWTRGRTPVFFPNITMVMVRPSAKEAHDPYLAMFRCSLQLSKVDIFNYLRQVYRLEGITSIRTAIQRGRYRLRARHTNTGSPVRRKSRDARETYKKVWVGLEQPFFFPAAKSAAWLDQHYRYGYSVSAKDQADRINVQRGSDSGMLDPKGFPDRGFRPDILGNVMRQRRSRNRAVELESRRLAEQQQGPAVGTTVGRDASKEAAPFRKGPVEAAMDAELGSRSGELLDTFEREEDRLRSDRARRMRKHGGRGDNDTLLDFEGTGFGRRFTPPKL